MKSARHVIICGRVQGVWFRGWTKQKATSLGLTGWVRNLRSGDVEAIFQGKPADIDLMLAACWQGPPTADVTNIEISECAPSNLQDFRQLATN